MFASYIGVREAIPVGSGRQGLEYILLGLELSCGDEVILPAYTLLDLAVRIRAMGLRPVFADIEPLTFTMDPDALKRKISPRTRVILATHMFGAPSQIARIMDIASQRGIFVVEDCAHAVGASLNGRMLGSFGTAGFFSFETIKPLNLYGGGMITTNNTQLAENIRKYITQKQTSCRVPVKKMIAAYIERIMLPTPLSIACLAPLSSRLLHKVFYGLYRRMQKYSGAQSGCLSPFQSYMGLLKLKTLNERISARQNKAALLRLLLPSSIRAQKIIEGGSGNYYFFIVRLAHNAWQARRYLLAHGVDAGIQEEIADDCATAAGDHSCPVARDIFEHALQLPLYEDMSEFQVRYIASLLNRFYS